MTPDTTGGPAEAADYGYDLAHEVPQQLAPVRPRRAPQVQAVPVTEADGDYEYDLAHGSWSGAGSSVMQPR